jgi:putative PEP-CTERM system TPR-repeat lipoprotein
MKIARHVQEQAAKSPVGFALEGDVLMANKKFLPAARLYETAYAIAKSGMLAIKLHEAYSQAGKSEEAEERLAQWLKFSPEDAATRLYSAAVSLKMGNYNNSIEQYEWLRQKNPDNIVVLNNLSWAYHQVKDARALPTAERAYKLKPDNPAVVDTLGTILMEQGHTERGLKLLQKAVADAPNSLTIRFHLAQAWLKVGEKARAREELVGLLSADRKFPEQNEAQDLLRELRK